MGGMIAVYPFVPARELEVGPGFDMDRIVRFIAKWSLVAVPDSPGEYLTADDIADGMLPRITAGIECFSINRPTAGEVDMAIDWMLTVGGTFIDFSGGLISNDVRWLEVTTEPDDGLLVFVVDDASRAHAAYRSQRSPTGIWDVRNGFDGVPVIVRRPMADYPPEVRWNGWLVVLHDGEIEVQTVPDHAFWGKPPRDVEPEITYWAENWAVRDVGGVLTAAHRDGRIVSIEVSANGPVVLSE